MSVLVEALSLIVLRKVLDTNYPGGTDAFMERMREPRARCRLVCADEQLVSLSFVALAEACVVEDELCALGVVSVENEHFLELALLDESLGPTMPCEWLEWRRHEDGFTSCWIAGSDPDDMHAPESWSPPPSRALVRDEACGEEGRRMKLVDARGSELWLDFDTGRISEIVVPVIEGTDPPEGPSTGVDTAAIRARAGGGAVVAPSSPLLGVVRKVLDQLTYKYHEFDARTIQLSILNDGATYFIAFSSREEIELLELMISYGSKIPTEARGAIAEAASRINTRLIQGNFELEFVDGSLRFRASAHVAGSSLSEQMVDSLLRISLFFVEKYHLPLMRIAFAGASAEDEIGKVPV